MLVFVGIPCIDGKPHAALTDSLLAETLIGLEQGVHFLVDWVIGISSIESARNMLAAKFKASSADVLVMIDADISWSCGDLISLARRPEKVIGGTYRAKRSDERFHIRLPVERFGASFRVGGLPGGFLKIDRSVFDALDVPHYEGAKGPVGDYFPSGIQEGEYLTEDYGFCKLCRAAGIDVWLDPSIRLKHWDGMRFFAGDPAWWAEAQIRKEAGTSIKYCMDAIRDRRDTPETYAELIDAWSNAPLWTASPDMLATLADLARKADGSIIEFGSGVSTLVLRAATDQPIVSYDEDLEWAGKVDKAIAGSGYAEVEINVGGYWKPGTVYPGGNTLAVIDGPADQGNRTRFYRLMPRILKDGGSFVVDDLHFDVTANAMRVSGLTYRTVECRNGKRYAIGSIA